MNVEDKTIGELSKEVVTDNENRRRQEEVEYQKRVSGLVDEVMSVIGTPLTPLRVRVPRYFPGVEVES